MARPGCRRHGGAGWWRSSVPGLWRLGLVLVGVFALPAAAGPDGVTYSRDIAPLLAANCQACHRDGEIAPFPLTSYDDAYRRRQKLLRTVERRKMPPWPPVPGHGDFVGERRLADADIARLRAWDRGGGARGRPTRPAAAPDLPRALVGGRSRRSVRARRRIRRAQRRPRPLPLLRRAHRLRRGSVRERGGVPARGPPHRPPRDWLR